MGMRSVRLAMHKPIVWLELLCVKGGALHDGVDAGRGVGAGDEADASRSMVEELIGGARGVAWGRYRGRRS